MSRIGRFFPLECIYGNYIICFSVRCVRRLKCSEACDELIKRRGEPAWKRLPHNSQDIDCKKFLTLKNIFTGVRRQCKKRKVNSSKNLHVVFEWQMHLIFSLLQPQKFNILIIANPSGLAVGQRGLELDTQFKIFCLIFAGHWVSFTFSYLILWRHKDYSTREWYTWTVYCGSPTRYWELRYLTSLLDILQLKA